MTVNELIAKLKDYGDEKARDLAQVRIVGAKGEVLDDTLDAFDVKFGIKSVDIPIDAQASLIYPDDDDDLDIVCRGNSYDDDWEDWEDDEDDEYEESQTII